MIETEYILHKSYKFRRKSILIYRNCKFTNFVGKRNKMYEHLRMICPVVPKYL